LQLKGKYRQMMVSTSRDDNQLFEVFDSLIKVRREYVTPVCHEIKKSGIDLNDLPATVQNSGELVSAISAMFHDLSDEAGSYMDEIFLLYVTLSKITIYYRKL